MVHGFVRNALDLVHSKRKEESLTAKRLSKFTADVAILDAKTKKTAEKDYHRMGAAIGEINESTERDKEVITAQYKSVGEISQAKQQQALASIQARQQKRIEGSKKPWKP
jgi:NAD/NADP transhydrogenase alpha subunit